MPGCHAMKLTVSGVDSHGVAPPRTQLESETSWSFTSKHQYGQVVDPGKPARSPRMRTSPGVPKMMTGRSAGCTHRKYRRGGSSLAFGGQVGADGVAWLQERTAVKVARKADADPTGADALNLAQLTQRLSAAGCTAQTPCQTAAASPSTAVISSPSAGPGCRLQGTRAGAAARRGVHALKSNWPTTAPGRSATRRATPIATGRETGAIVWMMGRRLESGDAPGPTARAQSSLAFLLFL